MATSPPHKFGQLIGNLLEDTIEGRLRPFCVDRGLFLDVKGPRAGVRKGQKVTWKDRYGNDHDLDFVIESDGSASEQGRPVAFIEVAWRRYTKHSRNKAQEIQSAILPIADDYGRDKPFLGVVLAGEFTKGSLDQLKSTGFEVLYFPYSSVVSAFLAVGIVAKFDEATPDLSYAKCVAQIEALSLDQYGLLQEELAESEKGRFDTFLANLTAVLDRRICQLIVLPLFGDEKVFSSINDTMKFVDDFEITSAAGEFQKFQITAKFSNGDTISASFHNKREISGFLEYLKA